MSRLVFSAFLALILLCQPTYSNTQLPELEEVVVTSSARYNSAEQQLPYSLHAIDEKSWQQTLPRSLPEALAGLPGVLVQKTANGHGSPFLRGFTGYRTLTLIDGVRYNNSVYRDGPNEYFSLIDFHGLHKVELLGGPASTLYGSDAIGGTLNLHTRSTSYQEKQADQAYWQAALDGRSASAENSLQTRLVAEAGQGKRWGLRAGVSDKHFGDVVAANIGRQKHTGYREQAADIRLDWTPAPGWQFTALHQQMKQDDVWRTHSTIYAKPFAGTSSGSDLKRLKDQQRSLSYLKLRAESPINAIDHATLTLSHQHWRERGERIRNSGKTLYEDFDSDMWGMDLSLASELAGIDWVYGIDYYVDFVDSARTDIASDGTLTERIQGPVGDDTRYGQFGAFLQAIVPVGNGSLHVGHRYNRVSARIGRFEDPATQTAADYAQQWQHSVYSLRLQRAMDDAERWQAWAGISQAFRAPNIADLSRYGGSRSNEIEVAATALQPEQFLTKEIGLRLHSDGMSGALALFHTDIKDFIASTATGRIIDGMVEVSKQNASAGAVYGAELKLDLALSHNLRLKGSASWLHGDLEQRVTSNEAPESLPMSRIQPFNASVELHHSFADEQYWWSFALTHNTKADRLSPGDRGDTQRIPPGGTPAYTRIDLRFGMLLAERIRLTLGVDNLLDEAYRNHGSGSNEPGIGLTAGLHWQLGD
jgi:hemoglobin/transferrin/lactoferrin receptor protein